MFRALLFRNSSSGPNIKYDYQTSIESEERISFPFTSIVTSIDEVKTLAWMISRHSAISFSLITTQ